MTSLVYDGDGDGGGGGGGGDGAVFYYLRELFPNARCSNSCTSKGNSGAPHTAISLQN